MKCRHVAIAATTDNYTHHFDYRNDKKQAAKRFFNPGGSFFNLSTLASLLAMKKRAIFIQAYLIF